jgi:ornithine cyclodeaminase/alanine dehydrogenase-like protein (mu-crystallin family)
MGSAPLTVIRIRMTIINFDESRVRELLPWGPLVDAIRQMFITGCEAPPRHHHSIPVPGGVPGTLLLMPAWRTGQFLGIKLVNIFPGNGAHKKSALSGLYILADANTGEILAQFDGKELTARRTAAASALAASYLARQDARCLLVVGTGRVSKNLAQAYCAVRPIEEILVFGRSLERIRQFIGDLRFLPARLSVASDLAGALQRADIVTSATLATEPVIHGRYLKPGAHVDLVGGFRPDMREADDDTIKRATAIFVDTREGATREAGDIVQPIAHGILAKNDIAADLFDLCLNRHPGRTHDNEITLFKSVGAALEDLAAAVVAFEQESRETRPATA